VGGRGAGADCGWCGEVGHRRPPVVEASVRRERERRQRPWLYLGEDWSLSGMVGGEAGVAKGSEG